MDKDVIKRCVQNYEWCSMDEIDDILNFIAERKKQELGIEFDFETSRYEDGGIVKTERGENGQQQVEIGEGPLTTIKEDKELGEEIDPGQERKEFIELILQTFHELRHVKQNDNIQDNPISTEENIKMTREKIINHSFTGFTNSNYEQSITEIDAMKASLEETARFFGEMGSDITPDEIFAVMQEKEFAYLGYDIDAFGGSYDTAVAFFGQISGKTTDIKGLEQTISGLPEDKKAILETECQDLMSNYNAETDVEKKMELLKQMSLKMTPELREQYPLADVEPSRDNETGFRLVSVNGKSLDQLTETYKNVGVGQTDVTNAFGTLKRTRDEKEQGHKIDKDYSVTDRSESR